MEGFRQYIRELRENRRLSLRDVEKLAEVSSAYISQIESGKRKNPPSPAILQKLAKAFSVSYESLLVRAGYLEPKGDKERERTRVNSAFDIVLGDPGFHYGTRFKGKRLSLETKKAIVEMYEELTGRRIL